MPRLAMILYLALAIPGAGIASLPGGGHCGHDEGARHGSAPDLAHAPNATPAHADAHAAHASIGGDASHAHAAPAGADSGDAHCDCGCACAVPDCAGASTAGFAVDARPLAAGFGRAFYRIDFPPGELAAAHDIVLLRPPIDA